MGAVVIGAGSLIYTSWLVKKLAQEERNKVELWSESMDNILKAGPESKLTEMSDEELLKIVALDIDRAGV